MIRTKPLMNGEEPAVEQPDYNGWKISWNPDDGRWYGMKAGVWVNYKERRNLLAYCQKH